MRRTLLVLVVLLVLGGLGYVAYQRFMTPLVPVFASDEEHFKYGSIGNDGANGVPYAIWVALPDVFADFLPGPGGYASLGFLWEAGRNPDDAPIGFSRARVGVERMAINCAFCHAVAVRTQPEAERHIYVGAASNTVDVQAYQRFLGRAAADPRFTADALLPAMQRHLDLSWLERQLYRFVLIPLTRRELNQQTAEFAWTQQRPDWGPGRIDPFNPVKFGMLDLADDGTLGNSDMQAVWNLDARERIRAGAPLHWDGLNTSIREVVVSSALGDGAVASAFDMRSMDRIERFLRGAAPPASPHRPDPASVERGAAFFEGACAECHGEKGPRTLTLIPVSEVGTDPERARMWTDAARDAYNNYREGYDWGFRHFQNVEAYITEPLQGLWLNGPYLHNGSVPTLADLLEQPSARPSSFIRGLDLVDNQRGGFAAPSCDPAQPPGRGFCFDTKARGNSNGGHLYGTELSPDAKADLLAYLLTL